eukprot:GHVU01121675.1.p1 GENE.GHVU01121675.1~~GHVU01121675.1.p1  ORF type:complete len:181 (-),score=52.67 GHVU01121675.1:94-612(-)
MSDAAQTRPTASSSDRVDASGDPDDAGTQSPTAGELMDALQSALAVAESIPQQVQVSMREMEGRIQSSMQQQIEACTQALTLMQQQIQASMQRMEERMQTSLQQHAEESRGIDVDRVRQCVVEALQLQQQQQQGAVAATHGLPHPVDEEGGEAGPGRGGGAAAPEDEATGGC